MPGEQHERLHHRDGEHGDVGAPPQPRDRVGLRQRVAREGDRRDGGQHEGDREADDHAAGVAASRRLESIECGADSLDDVRERRPVQHELIRCPGAFNVALLGEQFS